jgi:Flp pilus assembly protein TadG
MLARNRDGSSLRRDAHGGVALITAIGALPLLLFAGSAIDFARQVQSYRALTNAVDGAALAGATLLSESGYATDVPTLVRAYLTAAAAGTNITFGTPTIQVTANTVTVTLSATIHATLLGMLMATLPTSVSATAGGSTGVFSISATPNGTDAADLNSLYIYAENADGSKDLSHRTLLFDNSGTAPYAAGQAVHVSFSLGLGQRLAFELDNETGGRNAGWYNGHPNTYGSAVNTVNVYYTSDYPATLHTSNSTDGYSGNNQAAMVNANKVFFASSAQACFVNNGSVVPLSTFNSSTGYGTIQGPVQQQNVEVNGACANVTPTSPYNINPTCLELNGSNSANTMTIDWNDMGNPITVGDSDIYNASYTDMEFTFSCSTASGGYARTVLTN